MTMNTTIRKLPTNVLGKDYIVGDLHGCIDLLERLLDEVQFNPERDRLFSVGDLIDRGPDSLACLQLLTKPWCYAVQGNHESMLLNFFLPYLQNHYLDNLDDVNDTNFIWNGGDWVEHHFMLDQHSMIPEFDQGLLLAADLPLMWIIGEGEQRFHVIHAELLKPEFNYTKTQVWLDSDIDQWLAQHIIPSETEEDIYWSRTLMSQSSKKRLPALQAGLSFTFCGHNYAPKPRQVLSHVCVDTGAYLTIKSRSNLNDRGYGLTLFDVKNECYVSASYQRSDVLWCDFPLVRPTH